MKTLTQQIYEAQQQLVTVSRVENGKVTQKGDASYEKAIGNLATMGYNAKELMLFRARLNRGETINVEHPKVDWMLTISPKKGMKY